MARFSFVAAALLTIAGVGLGVYGIAEERFKPTATGLVLILGAAVFALLTIGARRFGLVERREL